MKKKIATWQDTVDAFNATDVHTLADAKALNKQNGMHFFDRKTMKYFASRIHGGMRRGKYFITSEKTNFGPEINRKFTVREFDWTTGNVKTVEGFLKFTDLDDAKAAIKSLGGK